MAMLAIAAQVIVFGALVGAFQCFIGFRSILELRLGILFLADVGVVFARQLAIGGLDRLVVCGRLHTENLVIVFEVHRGNHHPLSESRRRPQHALVCSHWFDRSQVCDRAAQQKFIGSRRGFLRALPRLSG
ncbi:hypothetical protein D3C84_826200 [compost metagenome]